MHKCKGFTLIEILIVVAIVGILAAIGFVVLNDKSDEAARSACKANVTALNNSIMLYAFKEGKNPDSLINLALNYLKSIPSCPLGQEYVYNKDFGEISPHSH